ncbi:hypothetical protein RRSWK_03962 [Rhodopirellula sp. SWK7]|nr:hypothetical protein RRSWK_03962 [Rhodopirellula sp. SWK7]
MPSHTYSVFETERSAASSARWHRPMAFSSVGGYRVGCMGGGPPALARVVCP